MSQTQGLVQEPQFMRSQVVAQQPSHLTTIKLILNKASDTLPAFFNFWSYHSSRQLYYYFSR